MLKAAVNVGVGTCKVVIRSFHFGLEHCTQIGKHLCPPPFVHNILGSAVHSSAIAYLETCTLRLQGEIRGAFCFRSITKFIRSARSEALSDETTSAKHEGALANEYDTPYLEGISA